jgi:exodeoxyribonuclease VII large subunit
VATAVLDAFISVSELNLRVAGLLERSLPLVAVTGEISNFTRAASGHLYFAIKDPSAQVRCVMFRGRAALLDFSPKEGDKVQLRALASFYQARGEFQLTVEQLRKAGAGGLYEQFLLLKAKLLDEGLFSSERKREIPPNIRKLAIVTSLQAAALRDVLASLARRAPHVQVVIYPCSVQGKEAPSEISQALRKASDRASKLNESQLILLVRGGGSIEDLWAFNDEAVARAIAASSVPVISGVGHETDTTIADFVADLRAPTPTAAAELATPDRDSMLAEVDYLAARLSELQNRRVFNAQQSLDRYTQRLQSPLRQWQIKSKSLDQSAARLIQAARSQSQQLRLRVQGFESRLRVTDVRRQWLRQSTRLDVSRTALQSAIKKSLVARQQDVASAAQALDLLGPTAVLARGYAIVKDAEGTVLRTKHQTRTGMQLQVVLKDGEINTVVL